MRVDQVDEEDAVYVFILEQPLLGVIERHLRDIVKITVLVESLEKVERRAEPYVIRDRTCEKTLAAQYLREGLLFIDEELRGRAAEASQEDGGIDVRARELAAITKGEVKQALLGTAKPTMEDCRAYLDRVDLYFGYAHTQSAVNQFINL